MAGRDWSLESGRSYRPARGRFLLAQSFPIVLEGLLLGIPAGGQLGRRPGRIRLPFEPAAVEGELPVLDLRDDPLCVGANASGDFLVEEPGPHERLEIGLILPTPGAVGRNDDVEHEIGRPDTTWSAHERLLEIDVPTPVGPEPAVAWRHPDGMPVVRADEPQGGSPPHGVRQHPVAAVEKVGVPCGPVQRLLPVWRRGGDLPACAAWAPEDEEIVDVPNNDNRP